MPQRPAALSSGNIPLARRPSQGGEFQVFLSAQDALEVGAVTVTGLNAGSYAPDSGYAVALAARPSELVVVLENGRVTSGNVAVHVVGTDQNDAALSGNAVLDFPAWCGVADSAFPTGMAAEVIVPAGRMFKTITGVTVTGAPVAAKDARLIVLGMPDIASYERVGCTTSKEIETPSRVGRPIACEMQGSAFTAAGRSRPGALTISAKDLGPGSLSRFDGIRTTVQIRVQHESVEARRYFMTGHFVSVRHSAPDGEEEATLSSQGPFERFALLLPADA